MPAAGTTPSGRAIAAVAAIAFLFGVGTPLHAEPPNVEALAGVYKRSFQNGNIDGDVYRTEDVLEVVRLSPATAYFRAHLEFYNGHLCSIWGVVERTESDWVYRGPPSYLGKSCILHLKIAGGKIVFDDEAQTCRELTCGARGMYSSSAKLPVVYFDRSSRRRIRYMETLRASWQYAEAIAEYAARTSTAPAKSAP